MHWLSPDQRFARIVFRTVAGVVTFALLTAAVQRERVLGWAGVLVIGMLALTGAACAMLHAASSSAVEHERRRASEDEDHRAR